VDEQRADATADPHQATEAALRGRLAAAEQGAVQARREAEDAARAADALCQAPMQHGKPAGALARAWRAWRGEQG
jgi:hypothetical protein